MPRDLTHEALYTAQVSGLGMHGVLAQSHETSTKLAEGSAQMREMSGELSGSAFVNHMRELLDSVID